MPDIRTLFSGIMLSTTCPSIASMKNLSAEALQHVAAYFQALSEPTRLQIMNLLREGELNVGEIADACGCSSANVSRHLTLLMRHGLVEREASPDDGRGVLAGITDSGRVAVEEALVTYGEAVRENFLGPLTRPQMSALGENCRRISADLKARSSAKFGRA